MQDIWIVLQYYTHANSQSRKTVAEVAHAASLGTVILLKGALQKLLYHSGSDGERHAPSFLRATRRP